MERGAGTLRPLHLSSRVEKARLELPTQLFSLRLIEGRSLTSADMTVPAGGFRFDRLSPDPAASRYSSTQGGWKAELDLQGPDGLEMTWSVELRDGSAHLRFALEIRPTRVPFNFEELVMFDGSLPGGRKAGDVMGVPVISDTFFAGYEHPQAENVVSDPGHVLCSLAQSRVVEVSSVYRASLVLGIVVRGQSRRSFLHYLERERAHPTRGMLHYNSWYDIGTGQPFTARAAAGRVGQIGGELAKRNVSMDAFLLDDGWDDPDSGPWTPHKGFDAASLAGLQKRAADYGAGLGVWFSPFGGYHEPRQRRLQAARRAGLPVREETQERVRAVVKAFGACSESSRCAEGEGHCGSNDHCKAGLECFRAETGVSPPGVDASGVKDKSINFCFSPAKESAYLGLGLPAYFAHFRDVVVKWIEGGARLLKLDGIGNPRGLVHTLAEDFDSAVELIAVLRKVSQSIFINLSTGTWASPFWLLHSDTVWRGGHDHYFHGEGTARERWITYRDSISYSNVIQRSPLFPMTSLMVHGVIFAKDAWDLTGPEGAGHGQSAEPFKHEVRSAFGSGVMLQELYLTPSLLSSENWDDIASAARWARARTRILADAHWAGGDPRQGQAYGWAAWRDAEQEGAGAAATLTLRNPSSRAQTVSFDPALLFELPAHARAPLILNSPFRDQRPQQLRLQPGSLTELELRPFAVLVFDTLSAPPDALTLWLDTLWDYSAALVWMALALVAGWAWRTSQVASGAGAAPPVPVEELRRRRLEALEKRGGAAT